MDHIIQKAYQTKALSLQHMILPRLPKIILDDNKLADQLLHLQLRFCCIKDEGLPPFGEVIINQDHHHNLN